MGYGLMFSFSLRLRPMGYGPMYSLSQRLRPIGYGLMYSLSIRSHCLDEARLPHIFAKSKRPERPPAHSHACYT